MKIKYLGHSCFLLTSEGGTTIVCDPYSGIGYEMPRVSADAVTLSHDHFDHNNCAAVGGNPTVINTAEACRVGDISISAVNSFHDECRGAKRGKNIIYKFSAGGLTVCHMGDLGEFCRRELAEKILPADVLLIPVGGNYTIDAAEAVKYISALSPAVAIPMHYAVEGGNINISGIEEFLAKLAPDASVRHAGCEVEISAADAQGKTQIIVMDRSDR